MIGCLPTQALAFLAVFVYATHATQAIAFEWKPGLQTQTQTQIEIVIKDDCFSRCTVNLYVERTNVEQVRELCRTAESVRVCLASLCSCRDEGEYAQGGAKTPDHYHCETNL